MSDETTSAPEAPAATTPPTNQPLTSLADIQKLCTTTRDVVFQLNGRECKLPVRQLTPAEEARVNDMTASVMPKITAGKTPEQDRVEYTDPDFIKRRNEANVKARAMALYWSVPAFAAMQPGLTDTTTITTFIQGQLNETVLNVLYQAAREGGVTLAEVVNFT